jgi:glycosyltransferase involved in cell wall biosynthesis
MSDDIKLNQPYVSIIIPSYNRLIMAVKAIESALNQDLTGIVPALAEYEVIVVFDGGLEVYTKLVKSRFLNNPKVRFIEKKNGGVSSALNVGIKEARGKFINWLSDDDMMEPHHLKSMLGKLQQIEWSVRMRPSMFYGGWKVIDKSDNEISPGENQHEFIPPDLHSNTIFPLIRSRIHGCALLVERSLFTRYGYFDENQVTTGDYHRWFTFLQKANIYLIDQKENSIKSRLHENQDSNSKNDIHIQECDRLWTYFVENFYSIKEHDALDSWKYVLTLQKHLKNSAYRGAYENLQKIVKLNSPTLVFFAPNDIILEGLIDSLTNKFDFSALINWAIYKQESDKSFALISTNLHTDLKSIERAGTPQDFREAFFFDFPLYGADGLVRDYDIRSINLSDSFDDELKNLENIGPWLTPLY